MSNKDQAADSPSSPDPKRSKSTIAEISDLRLRITAQSRNLVVVTDPDRGERFVANVALAVAPVVYPNHLYREHFGLGQFDPHGVEARQRLADLALTAFTE